MPNQGELISSAPEISVAIPIERKDLVLYYPPHVNFPGTKRSLELQTDIPKDLFHDSKLFPVKQIFLVDRQGENTSREITFPLNTFRYEDEDGGKLTIFLNRVWEIAKKYNAGDHYGKSVGSNTPFEHWWVPWVSEVDKWSKSIPAQPSQSFDSVQLAKNARLWEWLVTDIILTHAAISRLDLNQGLYKKIIMEKEPISSASILGSLLVLEALVLDKLGVNQEGVAQAEYLLAFIITAIEAWVTLGYVDRGVEAKIGQLKKQLRDESVANGPFLKISEFPLVPLPKSAPIFVSTL